MWGDVGTGFLSTYGHDTFAFRPNNGNDFIYDFHQGEDIIELGGFNKNNIPAKAAAHVPDHGLSQLLQSAASLNIQAIDTNGDNVADSSLIRFDANNSITVMNVTGLTAADFHFVV